MRTLIEIQNEIIRTKGNLEAINRHPFSQEDREILQPKYLRDLDRLEKEAAARDIIVKDPVTVKQV